MMNNFFRMITVCLKKKTFWAVAGFVLLALLIRYTSPKAPAAPVPNPEEMEEQHLVQEILKGSTLWAEALANEERAHEIRIKQERGNAGYRHVLCTKFGKVLSSSGSAVPSKDCASF